MSSTVMGMFDPLGLLAPVIMKGKVVLQQACAERLRWHNDVPERLSKSWQKWLHGLEGLHEVKIPRHYTGLTTVSKVKLHTLCDASDTGYGACCYLKVLQPGRNASVSLSFLEKLRLHHYRPYPPLAWSCWEQC